MELNSEKPILNFKSIFNDKRYSKIKISPTLGLKMMKSPPKKSHSSTTFQQYQELALICLKNLVIILKNFFDKKFPYSIHVPP
jgi:hypothetical protein